MDGLLPVDACDMGGGGGGGEEGSYFGFSVEVFFV